MVRVVNTFIALQVLRMSMFRIRTEPFPDLQRGHRSKWDFFDQFPQNRSEREYERRLSEYIAVLGQLR